MLDKAERTLKAFRGLLETAPAAAGQSLIALDFYLGPVQEFAIVGDPADPSTQALLAEVRRGSRPYQVVALHPEPANSVVPLMADRIAVGGRPTAYVCRGFVCRLPVTESEALRQELQEVQG